MPNLTPAREAMRMVQTMKVLIRVNHGERVDDACTAEGITPEIYYHWIATGSDAIENLQGMIVENERKQLELIVRTQSRLLDRIITLSEVVMSVKDLMEVSRFLREIRKDLENRYGVEAGQSHAEEYALSGPVTHQEKSMMGVEYEFSRTTVNIKAQPDGSVDLNLPRPVEIIDGETSD